MALESRLGFSLLMLRMSVFLVMLVWTLDKFVNPEHASRVFANFYGLQGLEQGAFVVIGLIELALLIGFLLGVWKRITYGAILILHAASTLSSFGQYLDPFQNLLFFAAWPMLAACVALYLLRDQDIKWSLAGLHGRTSRHSDS